VDPAFCRFPRLCRLFVVARGTAGAHLPGDPLCQVARTNARHLSPRWRAPALHLAINPSPPTAEVAPPQAEDFARFVQKETLPFTTDETTDET
jgi:hypothetical protein